MKAETVLVLGAHPGEERYANMATKMLEAKGHETILIGTRQGTIDGKDILTDWPDSFDKPVDTVTLYVNPQRQEAYKEKIAELHPKRVIFNPGTVNPSWAEELRKQGIQTENACTLVLLSTGQY